MIVLVNKKKFAKVIISFLIIIVSLITIANFNNIKCAAYPTKYKRIVEKYAKEYGIDKYLVYAVIKTESNFDENAVSPKGAVGLMQIMPQTGDEAAIKIKIDNYNEKGLSNPDINIHIGCYYISILLNRYSGDIKTALAAYNAGYGNVDEWLAKEQKNFLDVSEIPFGETKKYVVKIENNYSKYLEIYK